MIEKKISGQIALTRDPEVLAEGTGRRGCFTLEGLEELVFEARMAGVESKQSLWFNYQDSRVRRMYFPTTEQFAVEKHGKTVVYKNSPYAIGLSLGMFIILILVVIF